MPVAYYQIGAAAPGKKKDSQRFKLDIMTSACGVKGWINNRDILVINEVTTGSMVEQEVGGGSRCEANASSELSHYLYTITHYTLQKTHYTLHITHRTLHITHYTLHITQYTLHITH